MRNPPPPQTTTTTNQKQQRAGEEDVRGKVRTLGQQHTTKASQLTELLTLAIATVKWRQEKVTWSE